MHKLITILLIRNTANINVNDSKLTSDLLNIYFSHWLNNLQDTEKKLVFN